MPRIRQAQEGPCALEMPDHAIELSLRFLDALAPGDELVGADEPALPSPPSARLDLAKIRQAQIDCSAVRALRIVLSSVIRANPAAGRSDRDRLTLVMLALAGDAA